MRRGDTGRRVLATVMFTDIVGSSAIANELGDRRWKALVGRHHAIVRRELKRFGGREYDTAGDGFFVGFKEPAAAIACACAVADTVRAIGLEIRAGVHVGECEVMGRKLGGITVVVGARVASLGGPGDVVVTSTTRELVAGAGFSFEDGGLQTLKGVEGDWHVLRVTSIDGTPRTPPIDPDEASRRRDAIRAGPLTARRRSRALVLVGAFILIAATAGVLVLSGGGGSPLVPGINTIARIDTTSEAFDEVVPVGDLPSGVAIGPDAVWVINQNSQTFARVDPNTKAVVTTGSAQGTPTGIAYGEGSVWITNGFGGQSGTAPQVVRVDPADNRAQVAFEAPDAEAVAAGFGSVWLADSLTDRILRYDATTGSRTDSIAMPAGSSPSFLAVGTGSTSGIWVVNELGGTVAWIDPDTDKYRSFSVLAPTAVAASGDAVWVTSSSNDTVTLIDPATENTVTTLTLLDDDIPNGPHEVVVAPDGVWVSSSLDSVVALIDPSTSAVVKKLPVNGVSDALAVDADGNVWVTVHER